MTHPHHHTLTCIPHTLTYTPYTFTYTPHTLTYTPHTLTYTPHTLTCTALGCIPQMIATLLAVKRGEGGGVARSWSDSHNATWGPTIKTFSLKKNCNLHTCTYINNACSHETLHTCYLRVTYLDPAGEFRGTPFLCHRFGHLVEG